MNRGSVGVLKIEGIPTNDNELYDQYNKLVYRALYQHERVKDLLPDTIQQVWTDLFRRHAVKMFWAKMWGLPSKLQAWEICQYLGILGSDWLRCQEAKFTGAGSPWMPIPLKQDPLDCMRSVYSAYDIVTIIFKLDDPQVRGALHYSGGTNVLRHWGTRPASNPDRKLFTGYLMTCVKNNLSHVFRTRRRKCRDVLSTPDLDGCLCWETEASPFDLFDQVAAREALMDLDPEDLEPFLVEPSKQAPL
jgi:hypothetical protein